MNQSEFVAGVSALVEIVRDAPELARAVAAVFGDLVQRKDPTHSLRQVEGQAALHFLGLDDKR